MDWLKKNHIYLAISTVWIFQVSGIIGISLGFNSWFLPKTPLLLCINLVVLLYYFPISGTKSIVVSILIFALGMFVEWLGINNDFIFGAYYYGNNLGVKFKGVPYLIGVNWMILTFTTASIAQKLVNKGVLSIFIGSLLMLILDFFIEKSAPKFDFWIWTHGEAPLQNFVSWFAVALLMHSIVYLAKINSKSAISFHIYVTQLLFFTYFYFIF